DAPLLQRIEVRGLAQLRQRRLSVEIDWHGLLSMRATRAENLDAKLRRRLRQPPVVSHDPGELIAALHSACKVDRIQAAKERRIDARSSLDDWQRTGISSVPLRAPR
ncbi:MAG TPA: hypothetical protein VF157_05265, partial [Chloroflexota bacterium]